jgi:hypothetical protein
MKRFVFTVEAFIEATTEEIAREKFTKKMKRFESLNPYIPLSGYRLISVEQDKSKRGEI